MIHEIDNKYEENIILLQEGKINEITFIKSQPYLNEEFEEFLKSQSLVSDNNSAIKFLNQREDESIYNTFCMS